MTLCVQKTKDEAHVGQSSRSGIE